MNRIPTEPPFIKPVPKDVVRPLWSVMIPVYNCIDFLQETLESVLSQSSDSSYMQIEVVDDASTDADVKGLVAQLGQGRVRYFRQAENVGSLRNFETCLNRAEGHLVHLLHGDDRVQPGFYAKFTTLFEQFPEAGAAFCRYAYIDGWGRTHQLRNPEMHHDGILLDFLPRIAEYNRSQYVSTVVKRSVYEQIGSFYGVTFGEDWEMWVRIARYFPIAYTPDVLADYRCHNKSISDYKLATGQSIRDLRLVINTIEKHLPPRSRKKVLSITKKHHLAYGLYGAYNSWKTSGNYTNIRLSIREAFRLYSGFQFYATLYKIFLKILLHRSLSLTPKATMRILHLLGKKIPN